MRDDAVIIGGSFAGLSAAMYLARARRRVRVIDAGAPRNRFADRSHGFFGHDGSTPAAMLANARAQVQSYPTVSFSAGEAVGARPDGDGFSISLRGGDAVAASRIVLAFGIADELPAIPGLAERWGKSVLHCPYCHGFEFSGQRLGVLSLSPRSVHQAMLISEWGPTTFFLNGDAEPDAVTLAEMQRRHIAVERTRVRALHGQGTVLSEVELADGRVGAIDALYIGPRTRLNSSIAAQLGCTIEDGAFGPVITTDGQRMTSVPGVFAAGDIVRAAHNITWACADGVTAGTAVHRSLVF
ncbi:MAG TPA: NAD(P)/FAD-dependent oxidoreductase [Vicinamibacterales bacterium]|nr:NAD(P)/FAD-dependent oxidoreductase [Vicinamibacterales bacterium]